jgi:transposase
MSDRHLVDEVLDMLILGGYSFRQVAEEFEISIKEVADIYSKYLLNP